MTATPNADLIASFATTLNLFRFAAVEDAERDDDTTLPALSELGADLIAAYQDALHSYPQQTRTKQ